MVIDLVSVKEEEKSILANLLEFYQYEFSEFDGFEMDKTGRFGYKYLNNYWQDKNRYPFFIKVNGKLAGFVLVNNHTYATDDKDTKTIAEFFVLKKYRRQGIGKQAAIRIFNMYPGKWELRETNQNKQAQKFWRDAIKEYTKGNYQEILLDNKKWKGPVQIFKSK